MMEQNGSKKNIPIENKLDLLFLGILSFSFLGAIAYRQHWVGYIFFHTGALSIMGFYGCLSAIIAKSKGYNYWRAFSMAFLLPIILGLISAFLFNTNGEGDLPLTCGGWVSLGSGIGVVVFFIFIKKRGK